MGFPSGFVPAQIQDTYVCSGHGIWDPADGRFAVPTNVTLIFWVHHGEQLTHGTKIEDLILAIDEQRLPDKGFNRDPRELATPRRLMGFESRTEPAYYSAAAAADAAPGPPAFPPRPADRSTLPPPPKRPVSRIGLPEVIGGGGSCYNYQLERDAMISMNVNMQKIRIMEAFSFGDMEYPSDNVITIEPFGEPRRLKEIIDSINTVGGRQIQVHWAACRSILR